MTTYVAFLRGMNLGKRRIKMDDLRKLFEGLRFSNVATFIASGNVIFEGKTPDEEKLQKQIQAYLEKSLGYQVDVFLRTRAEVAAVAAFQPFPKAEVEAPENTLHVGFLTKALNTELKHGLLSCRTEVDELFVEGREYYWLCRIKTNESKVWTSPKMRALKVPSSTMRNMTTVKKIAALLEPR